MSTKSLEMLKQASVANPNDPNTWSIPAIEAYYQQYPGAQPNGTGSTGLMSNDSKGYSNLVNMGVQYQKLKSGKPVSTSAHYGAGVGELDTQDIPFSWKTNHGWNIG